MMMALGEECFERGISYSTHAIVPSEMPWFSPSR